MTTQDTNTDTDADIADGELESEEVATWLESQDADEPPASDVIELQPPQIRTTRFGLPEKLWRMYRYRRKREKLISKGYVQWYLIDDSFPRPKFIKPEFEGEGLREYQYKGKKYVFPRGAMLPSEEQGMWTVVHKKGEMDPVNLRDPSATSLPADAMKSYLDMKATAAPPSFFDKFDMDAADAMKWLMVAFAALAILQQVL